jgi:hypothetical protein
VGRETWSSIAASLTVRISFRQFADVAAVIGEITPWERLTVPVSASSLVSVGEERNYPIGVISRGYPKNI